MSAGNPSSPVCLVGAFPTTRLPIHVSGSLTPAQCRATQGGARPVHELPLGSATALLPLWHKSSSRACGTDAPRLSDLNTSGSTILLISLSWPAHLVRVRRGWCPDRVSIIVLHGTNAICSVNDTISGLPQKLCNCAGAASDGCTSWHTDSPWRETGLFPHWLCCTACLTLPVLDPTFLPFARRTASINSATQVRALTLGLRLPTMSCIRTWHAPLETSSRLRSMLPVLSQLVAVIVVNGLRGGGLGNVALCLRGRSCRCS